MQHEAGPRPAAETADRALADDRHRRRAPGHRRGRRRPLPASPHGSTAAATGTPTILPLDVVATTPATGATDVVPSATITVDLSTPLAPTSPMPTFSPSGRRHLVAALRRPTSSSSPAGRSSPAPGVADDPRRPDRARRRRGPAPDGDGDRRLHGGPGLDPAPAAAARPARLPAGQLHAGHAVDVAAAGGRRPAGHVLVALGQPAGLADLAVDARHIQRHHQGRHHELRDTARPEDRRAGRPAGLDRPAPGGDDRGDRPAAVRLRLVTEDTPGDRDRLPERLGRLLDAGQHRRAGRGDRDRDVPRLRPLQGDDDERDQPRRAPTTATPASRGSATSTAATPCTGTSAAATASPRATAASRCRRRTPRSSGR